MSQPSTSTLDPAVSGPGPRPGGRRIVFTTWGSFGDLHPAMAVARGLLARGEDGVATACDALERCLAEHGARRR